MNGVCILETMHERRELPLAQCERGGGDDDALAFAMPAVAGHLERRFHADDRNVIVLPQFLHGARRGCVAGDDDRLGTLFDEILDNAEREVAHLLGSLRAVWGVRRVAEIEDSLMRQIRSNLPDHGDAAESGIEHAYRCAGGHGSLFPACG